MKKVPIGVCDADPAMAQLLRRLLLGERYEVVTIGQHNSALEIMREDRLHLLLLDNPNLCHKLRQQGLHIPVLVLSTEEKAQEIARVLDLGADDYIIKPFGSAELLARVNAQLRRTRMSREGPLPPNPTLLTSADGNISLDSASHLVHVEGQPVQLTSKEFLLLQQLMLHKGKMLTHRMLLQSIWGTEHDAKVRCLHFCIYQLRKKVEKKPGHHYIVAERGAGFTFQSFSTNSF